MQQALTQPEIRLRFIIKFLLLVSILLIVLHLFPNWMPENISGMVQDGYPLFSNGSMVQAVLLILLMGLIIGDIRRFNQIIRVIIVFLIIDLVVSSTLMSMGMMMMPPATVSLPLKVLLFVLVDGWGLIVHSLVLSFHS